jgi:hypothetical protein
MPERFLNIAVDQLIEDVGTKVLGKRKMEEGDGIVVEKAMELPCNVFNKLRQDNWFNAWLFDSWHGDVG